MESTPDYWFTYQPILDRQQRQIAIALQHKLFVENKADSESIARVVVDAYLNSELVGLLGNRKVLINIDAAFLESGMVSILEAGKVVLALTNPAQFTEETLTRCQEFKDMGYVFALADFIPTARTLGLLDQVEMVKVDISTIPRDKLAEIAKMLKEHPAKLLAEKVETQEDFAHCLELGFDLFQGHYFAHPKLLVGRRPDPKRANILNILALIDQDVSDKEIEEAFKQSPDLTLHLLRLVNSAAFGLHTQIGSIREALGLFGRSKLSKWLQILLFLDGEASGAAWALFGMAARRGRMLEKLVMDVTHQSSSLQQDRGFMVGMLSVVDALLGAPMEEVLPQIGVIEDIQQAIMAKAGVLGTLLTLCEALEIGDFDAMVEAASKCSIPLARVMEVQREATVWAQSIELESSGGE